MVQQFLQKTNVHQRQNKPILQALVVHLTQVVAVVCHRHQEDLVLVQKPVVVEAQVVVVVEAQVVAVQATAGLAAVAGSSSGGSGGSSSSPDSGSR